jgi:UPF0716 protein FxsA
MRALLLLILLYPLAEIVALIAMAQHFGGMATFVFLLLSMLFGLLLLRNQKFAMLLSLGSLLGQRSEGVALYPLLWPLRTLIAGVLFMIPGPISDLIGLILLLPIKGPTIHTARAAASNGLQPDDNIEGDFTPVDETIDRGRHLR